MNTVKQLSQIGQAIYAGRTADAYRMLNELQVELAKEEAEADAEFLSCVIHQARQRWQGEWVNTPEQVIEKARELASQATQSDAEKAAVRGRLLASGYTRREAVDHDALGNPIYSPELKLIGSLVLPIPGVNAPAEVSWAEVHSAAHPGSVVAVPAVSKLDEPVARDDQELVSLLRLAALGATNEMDIRLLRQAALRIQGPAVMPTAEVDADPDAERHIPTNGDRTFSMKDRHFAYAGEGFISDGNFDFDAGLKVSGDFVDDDKANYCRMIVSALNHARTLARIGATEPLASPVPPRTWEELFELVALTAGCIPGAAPGENDHVVRVVRQLAMSAKADVIDLTMARDKAWEALGRIVGVLLRQLGMAIDMKADIAAELERGLTGLKERLSAAEATLNEKAKEQ